MFLKMKNPPAWEGSLFFNFTSLDLSLLYLSNLHVNASQAHLVCVGIIRVKITLGSNVNYHNLFTKFSNYLFNHNKAALSIPLSTPLLRSLV
jgi:hypothetical protein